MPEGVIFHKFRSADGRIVPEEAVASGGIDVGNRAFAVLLQELYRGALQVEAVVGVLPHAVEMFIRLLPEVKTHPELVAGGHAVFPRSSQRSGMYPSVDPGLFQQDFAGIRPVVGDGAVTGDFGRNLSVNDLSALFIHVNLYFRDLLRRKERPVQFLVDVQAFGTSETDRVLSAGFQIYKLSCGFPDQSLSADLPLEFGDCVVCHLVVPPILSLPRLSGR